MEFDALTLSILGGVTLAVMMAVKKIPKLDAELLPLTSIIVGALLGFGASFFVEGISVWQGITAGILASGGFDLIKGTTNSLKIRK